MRRSGVHGFVAHSGLRGDGHWERAFKIDLPGVFVALRHA